MLLSLEDISVYSCHFAALLQFGTQDILLLLVLWFEARKNFALCLHCHHGSFCPLTGHLAKWLPVFCFWAKFIFTSLSAFYITLYLQEQVSCDVSSGAFSNIGTSSPSGVTSLSNSFPIVFFLHKPHFLLLLIQFDLWFPLNLRASSLFSTDILLC